MSKLNFSYFNAYLEYQPIADHLQYTLHFVTLCFCRTRARGKFLPAHKTKFTLSQTAYPSIEFLFAKGDPAEYRRAGSRRCRGRLFEGGRNNKTYPQFKFKIRPAPCGSRRRAVPIGTHAQPRHSARRWIRAPRRGKAPRVRIPTSSGAGSASRTIENARVFPVPLPKCRETH